ncbi:hypothetical protein TNCT_239371 [Trichonephila clavata]|uniref:Uncharacterized protein n=1 Tax=Trichonephila clavata TaxID=2740835 RepID=A0A8X6H2N7_TRICU|nr:hypothetical protein TNCT_239371 [Trichonephila clavata]
MLIITNSTMPGSDSSENDYDMRNDESVKRISAYFPGSGGIRTHAPEETGALNQRLRPLGHATVERSLVLSFTAHKLLILQNDATILVKAKRISLAAVGFEPRPEETGALNQRLRPLCHATVERSLVCSFTLPKLLILQNNVIILVKAKRIFWQRWDSNPRPRRDWCLKQRLDRRTLPSKGLRCSFTAHKFINSSKQVTILLKAKRISWKRWIRNHASEETGALNQRLRPLGHATVERSLVLSFTAHNLLILQNIVTILLKAKRISLATVGFEPTPPKRLVP